MEGKLLVVTLPVAGASDATEAASLVARLLRAADRSLDSKNLVQFPWLEGSRGTLDFLVTHTLGSFLEVEATGASGQDVVVPIGFAGEDGKLAIIEMARLAAVPTANQEGTTAGIGELIQDALDEGAFSILLCHEEPLAFDAGFGAASALGIRFFDSEDKEIDFSRPGAQLSKVHRIDASGRSFALLSSRIFIALSAQVGPSAQAMKELKRLSKIVRRDIGVSAPLSNLSTSAVEFGLSALVGAELRDGSSVVREASRIEETIDRGDYSMAVILAGSMAELEARPVADFLERLRTHIPARAIIVLDVIPTQKTKAKESVFSLTSVPVFQQPLRPNATQEELRRDLTMRLEKLLPEVLTALNQQLSAKPVHVRHA